MQRHRRTCSRLRFHSPQTRLISPNKHSRQPPASVVLERRLQAERRPRSDPNAISMETSGRYQETVDTDTFHPSDPPEYEQAEPANPGQVLPLPAPSEDASGRQQLELGERAQMDHLGPLVIGEDGSVGRIANWTKLTEREREVALRRITARNRERLQRLRGEGAAAQQQGEQQQQGQDGSGPGAVGPLAAAVEPGRQQ